MTKIKIVLSASLPPSPRVYPSNERAGLGLSACTHRGLSLCAFNQKQDSGAKAGKIKHTFSSEAIFVENLIKS